MHGDPVWMSDGNGNVDYGVTYYLWNSSGPGPIKLDDTIMIGYWNTTYNDWGLMQRKFFPPYSCDIGGWVIGDWAGMTGPRLAGKVRASDYTSSEVTDLRNYQLYGVIPIYAFTSTTAPMPVSSDKYSGYFDDADCNRAYEAASARCRQTIPATQTAARERCWAAAQEDQAQCVREMQRRRSLKFWAALAAVGYGLLVIATDGAALVLIPAL